MKYIVAIAAALSLGWSASGGWSHGAPQERHECPAVLHALEARSKLKVGTTRREVEKLFDRDGGLQFPESTRYVFRECREIKVDIEFKHVPSGTGPLLSDEDTVTKVSTLYLQYPAKD